MHYSLPCSLPLLRAEPEVGCELAFEPSTLIDEDREIDSLTPSLPFGRNANPKTLGLAEQGEGQFFCLSESAPKCVRTLKIPYPSVLKE